MPEKEEMGGKGRSPQLRGSPGGVLSLCHVQSEAWPCRSLKRRCGISGSCERRAEEVRNVHREGAALPTRRSAFGHGGIRTRVLSAGAQDMANECCKSACPLPLSTLRGERVIVAPVEKSGEQGLPGSREDPQRSDKGKRKIEERTSWENETGSMHIVKSGTEDGRLDRGAKKSLDAIICLPSHRH